MIKRLLFTILPLFFFVHVTLAADPINFQDLSCGVASDTTKNKCCVVKNPNLAIPNTGNPALNVVTSALNGISELLLGPFTNWIKKEVTEPMQTPCWDGVPSTPGDITNPRCICIAAASNSLSSVQYLCEKTSSAEQARCNSCFSNGGVWSSIGCVQADVKLFIQDIVLKTGVGIAGGISLLCILFAAFQMQTSQGNAEKIKKAQQLLTNCITGLMFIVFSVLILKIIGVDILRIPGFR